MDYWDSTTEEGSGSAWRVETWGETKVAWYTPPPTWHDMVNVFFSHRELVMDEHLLNDMMHDLFRSLINVDN